MPSSVVETNNLDFMKKHIQDLFLNDKLILVLVIFNAVVIFLQESGIHTPFLMVMDETCTILFVIEMIVKISVLGMKGYWRDKWNALDGTVTLLSLPALLLLFFPVSMVNLTFLQVLRVLRLFKLIRAGRFFTNLNGIVRGFKLALRESAAILLGFIVLIIIVAMVNCCLFRTVAPDYFDTPIHAIYSMFRFFTIEGWYEIPDDITAGASSTLAALIRLYFCLLLFAGGVIGMSLINSIFVDAMVADNNDEVQTELRNLKEQLTRIEKLLMESKGVRAESGERKANNGKCECP